MLSKQPPEMFFDKGGIKISENSQETPWSEPPLN